MDQLLEQTRYALEFSSLIFFNVFCVLGIITFLIIINAINKLKNKTEQTMENISEMTSNAGETMKTIAAALPFRQKRESNLWDVLKTLLSR